MKFCLLQFSQIMFNQFQIVSMHIYLYIPIHPVKLIDKCHSEIHVIATIEQIQGVLSSKYSGKVSRISVCVFLECSEGQHHFQGVSKRYLGGGWGVSKNSFSGPNRFYYNTHKSFQSQKVCAPQFFGPTRICPIFLTKLIQIVCIFHCVRYFGTQSLYKIFYI